MKAFLAAFKKEITEQWRTSRMLVVVLVLGLFGLASPLLARFTPQLLSMIPEAEAFAPFIPEPTLVDAYVQYNSNIVQFGVILAILVAMGLVVQEKEKKTAALVLTKPLSRPAFLAAKFLAVTLTFAVGLAVAALGAYYYTLLLFEAPQLSGWLVLNGLVLVYLLVHVAVTLFFSTLARSTVAAAGMAFGAMLLLAVLGAIPGFGVYAPAQLVAWGQMNLLGLPDTAWPALVISLALILVSLLGAWWLFEKQEI
jgi:ABC-2 type transport system permease protein